MGEIKVLFFRGLNTYGSDRLQLGPLDFGPVHARLVQAFKNHEVQVIPVLEFGSGSLEEQIEKAIFYAKNQNLIEKNEKIHLLGHSTGGLIAQGFAKKLEDQNSILSVTTLATPHYGTLAAEKAISLNQKSKIRYGLLKSVGYDTKTRLKSFEALTRENCLKFKAENDLMDNIVQASVTFSLPKKDMSHILKFSHRLIHGMRKGPESDGLIELDSQRWGQHIGHFKLDHVGQLGFNFYTDKEKKKLFNSTFSQMITDLAKFWLELQKQNNKNNRVA